MSKVLNARTKKDLEAQLSSYDMRWWQGLPYNRGAFVNAYTCPECQQSIVTWDRDPGTTPSGMSCKATEGCSGWSMSSGYPSSALPDRLKHCKVFEWYRPEAGPLGLFHEDQLVDEYVRRGGLLLRERDHDVKK